MNYRTTYDILKYVVLLGYKLMLHGCEHGRGSFYSISQEFIDHLDIEDRFSISSLRAYGIIGAWT
jgi:hypothetical protein